MQYITAVDLFNWLSSLPTIRLMLNSECSRKVEEKGRILYRRRCRRRRRRHFGIFSYKPFLLLAALNGVKDTFVT